MMKDKVTRSFLYGVNNTAQFVFNITITISKWMNNVRTWAMREIYALDKDLPEEE